MHLLTRVELTWIKHLPRPFLKWGLITPSLAFYKVKLCLYIKQMLAIDGKVWTAC